MPRRLVAEISLDANLYRDLFERREAIAAAILADLVAPLDLGEVDLSTGVEHRITSCGRVLGRWRVVED